jgi:uncharacterized protein (TIGR02145 family)
LIVIFNRRVMKKFFCTLFLAVLLFNNLSIAQGVSVSENAAEPHESAIMDISSTNKGLLLPRMTTAERNAIVNPAESLLIFNTDTKCFETFVYGVWQNFWCASVPCFSSTEATSINGTLNICTSGSTTLSINGGSLGTGAVWRWYSSTCGGVAEGEGISLLVSPLVNTTYFVRAEGDCDTTNCVQATVTIISEPVAPVADAASGITAAGFTANWQSVSGASSYFLEVSDDSGFADFVFNADVGNNLSQSISSLSCATTYYYRVRAVNSCGDSDNSNTINLTTSACGCTPAPCTGTPTVSYYGFTYNTVQIGTQCWMVENLRNTQYRNGTAINAAETSGLWSAAGTDGRYCTPPSGNGLFYNYYAATSANNLCPTGWRTPTQTDFNTLVANITDAASIMDDDTWVGTNSCGWTGVPGGYRAGSGTYYDSQHGFWWSSTNYNSTSAIDFRLYNYLSYQINTFGTPKVSGEYVKCIKQ